MGQVGTKSGGACWHQWGRWKMFHSCLIFFSEPCVFWIQKSTANRVSTSRGLIAEAINAVSYKELSLSKAAEKYGISLRSLKRHCQKAPTKLASPTTYNYIPTHKIFSCQDEEDLAAYVKTDVSCLVGISSKEV
ncbi:hypothetical protein AVEN_136239-1 [Araneus ventricosus]|uniref:HTH psq-type domain-containing protein n=1 Tax=Araneus ventricosus TaxID=182803 RepID=A0A4Y2QK56_ARAVE|nr:hypothetical protein AVEN_171810-1 [Araneus ventricosus]GBN63683.1 hypothetical protein AVEN_136239-1 [Araneus ventricosus]